MSTSGIRFSLRRLEESVTTFFYPQYQKGPAVVGKCEGYWVLQTSPRDKFHNCDTEVLVCFLAQFGGSFITPPIHHNQPDSPSLLPSLQAGVTATRHQFKAKFLLGNNAGTHNLFELISLPENYMCCWEVGESAIFLPLHTFSSPSIIFSGICPFNICLFYFMCRTSCLHPTSSSSVSFILLSDTSSSVQAHSFFFPYITVHHYKYLRVYLSI